MRLRLAAPTLLAAGLLVAGAGCSDDEDDPTITAPSASASTEATSATTTPTADVQRIEVRFEDGEVSGDTDVSVELGTPLALVVTSDVDEEIHNHLNDETLALPAGETVTMRFDASAPGIFPIELHESDELLVELRITG